ncbi:uncharacterized protein LOC142349037 [Convolutriloba macropyga]|uniref:uncharacterized protein LOC142349037 n=1 Tax=Convolutriloba macropyga TaxID=536237 RepID=UPI003F522680
MYLSPSPTAVCSGWCASRAVMLMYFLCWIMTSAELYQGDNLVRIGLIYSSNESTVWPAGWTSLPTAELALEKITESGILPGNVELEIVLINSGCNKANARNMVLDRVRDGDIVPFSCSFRFLLTI